MASIVIDARELRTSSGRYVERLLHYLQKLDKKNQYSVLLKPQDMAGWQPARPNFQKVACPHKEFSFAEQLGLKRQINSLRPDLVHFTFPQQPIRYQGKVVTTIHDLTTLRFNNPDKNRLAYKFKQRVYGRVINRAAHKSAALIVPSKFVKDDVARFAGISSDKISVTYEAADSIRDKPQPLGSLEGKQFIMYVGRPTPHKNLERLVEAFVRLKAQHPELKLVLAGKKDANYSRVETSAREHTIRGVVFAGYVSEGRLRWLYQNCAAYVFPSLSEGFGLPGLEAMRHGAPVVSSKATCLPEIYGKAARYFDPHSEKAMAKAVNEVLVNKALRSKLAKAGKARSQQYSWQRMAQQTLSIYDEVLAKDSSLPPP